MRPSLPAALDAFRSHAQRFDDESPAGLLGPAGAPPSALIVYGDRATANAMRVALDEAGVSGRIVGSVDVALTELRRRGADLVVIGVDGDDRSIDDIRRLQSGGTPLFAIGQRLPLRTTCAVLDAGADDWLPVPFHPDEFRARCVAVLRRRYWKPQRRLMIGPMEIDLDSWSATVHGRPVALTRSDWQVLDKLARRPGAVVPHAELGGVARSPASQHALARARIARLRRRLISAGATGQAIRLAAGQGYRLALDAS